MQFHPLKSIRVGNLWGARRVRKEQVSNFRIESAESANQASPIGCITGLVLANGANIKCDEKDRVFLKVGKAEDELYLKVHLAQGDLRQPQVYGYWRLVLDDPPVTRVRPPTGRGEGA